MIRLVVRNRIKKELNCFMYSPVRAVIPKFTIPKSFYEPTDDDLPDIFFKKT